MTSIRIMTNTYVSCNLGCTKALFDVRFPFQNQNRNIMEMDIYLGIPEGISGSKCKLFVFLKDKLMHRVNGWTCR